MTPWLALIESNTSGTGALFARAVASQGCRPVLLTQDPSRYPYAQNGLDVLLVDTSKAQRLLHVCRRLGSAAGLAGVASSSEYFLGTAATLAWRLGLPGPHPRAIRVCRNKWRQRLLLSAARIPAPRFQCVASARSAVAAAEEIGLPVVVKPLCGTGSIGVRLCESFQAVSLHAAGLLRKKRNERGQPLPRRILIEENVAGPEYSVETFGLQVVGITRKLLGPLPHFVEVGHDYPAALPSVVEAAIHSTVLCTLRALNLGWGPAHIELRLTSDGPKIIEVNARLAGGYIPELVRLASGLDLISATIALAAGKQPSLERRLDRSASIRFILAPSDGALARITGLRNAARIGGVTDARLYRKRGERILRHADFRDRIGHVIASADTAVLSRAAARLAHSCIKLSVRPLTDSK